MTSIRKWALALSLALSFLPYSNAQDITGNLSDPWAWQNAGQIGVPITCMAPGQPGYCGPGPSVGGFSDPGGINFSYGITDLYQLINIANVLPNSGTGLVVTGFNFGFTAKNGNGWDGGGLDTLSAYVNFYNKSGATVESYNYNLNYVFNWTTFNYSETFASPYRTNQISTARFGFVGGDSNGWAGFYGPEVYNVSFSLKYAPDPCVTNPLSSPSCPGFSSALASLSTVPATPTAPASNTTDPAATQPTTTTVVSIVPTTISVTGITAAVTTASAGNTVQSNNRPALVSPRLESIIRSVNESVNNVVQNTLQQSTASIATANIDSTQQNNQSSSTDTFAIASVSGSSGASPTSGSDAPAANFTRPGDPAAAARGLTMTIPQEPVVETKTQPRNPQPPAELAGGANVVTFQNAVDITAYTTMTLRDAAFYTPREIYRGQQNVDNRRALQGLGSDRRHEEMINQQYQ